MTATMRPTASLVQGKGGHQELGGGIHPRVYVLTNSTGWGGTARRGQWQIQGALVEGQSDVEDGCHCKHGAVRTGPKSCYPWRPCVLVASGTVCRKALARRRGQNPLFFFYFHLHTQLQTHSHTHVHTHTRIHTRRHTHEHAHARNS